MLRTLLGRWGDGVESFIGRFSRSGQVLRERPCDRRLEQAALAGL